jgi:death on curing protein
MAPHFLTIEIVLALHAELLAEFGGREGLRDGGLLESALAQPMATFEGAYLHEDLHAMAAAYLFHVVQNHPFVDGNKRTGYLAALVFLDLNGIPTPHVVEMYRVTMGVADGSIDKATLAATLRRLFPPPSVEG